ncbi:MAG: response regulator transcription factor [Lachnospiraceae bacterium]|nr:response regulator transcription factor [Lachnospiraceae bacterium]
MVDILLIEDHTEQAQLLARFLAKDGYRIEAITTGEAALSYLRSNGAKLIILDIMLPGIDGFSVCAAIRKESNVPILVLSARMDKEDQMNGFHLGADDYLEKPIDMDILRAKIGALMRRNYSLKQTNMLLHSGALRVNRDNREVQWGDNLLPLTMKEYELLLVFIENPGKTLRKEFLFGKIWGDQSESENQTLTVHVKMLRDKIEKNPKNPQRIKTIWGVGYRYEEIEEDDSEPEP